MLHSLSVCAGVRGELEESVAECSRLKGTVSDLQGKVSRLEKELTERSAKLREEETMRRKLHNTIQELKVGDSTTPYNKGM